MSAVEKLKQHREDILNLKLMLVELPDIDDQIIEMLCLPGMILSDVPRTITNAFHSKTENAASLYCNILNAEKKAIINVSKQIIKTQLILDNLTEVENFIVKNKYLSGERMPWNKLCKLYSTKFDEYISIRTIKYHNKKLLLKLDTLL